MTVLVADVLTRVTTVTVALSPGASVPIFPVTVRVEALVLVVPLVLLALEMVSYVEYELRTVTSVAGALPLLVTRMVKVKFEPTRASPGLTALVIAGLGVIVPVMVGVVVRVGVGSVPVTVLVGELVAVGGVPVIVAVRVAVPVAVEVLVGGVPVSVGLDVKVGVGGVPVIVAVAVLVSVGVTVAVPVSVGVGVWVSGSWSTIVTANPAELGW